MEIAACSRTEIETSISSGEIAGTMLPATPWIEKNSSHAVSERRPASLACGNGSFIARANAGNNTFGRVASLSLAAILPRQIVVFVRIAGSESV